MLRPERSLSAELGVEIRLYKLRYFTSNLPKTIGSGLFLSPKVSLLKFKLFGWVSHHQYFKYINIFTIKVG